MINNERNCVFDIVLIDVKTKLTAPSLQELNDKVAGLNIPTDKPLEYAEGDSGGR